jgi:hypothetical protein
MKIYDENSLFRSVPSSSNSPGGEGWWAVDESYIYIYQQGSWARMPISSWED